MGEQFGKVKKTLAILLAVFFVISLTAAAVSAAPEIRDGRDGYDRDGYDHDYDHDGYGGYHHHGDYYWWWWHHHHRYHDYDHGY